MLPFVFIKTTWSDDSIIRSEPVEEWFGQWILMFYGDKDFWTGRVRPVRASLVDYHLFPVEELDIN